MWGLLVVMVVFLTPAGEASYYDRVAEMSSYEDCVEALFLVEAAIREMRTDGSEIIASSVTCREAHHEENSSDRRALPELQLHRPSAGLSERG